MTDKRLALQMCPMSPRLETGLNALFEVQKLFVLEETDRWLSAHGADVVAVVTSGHVGVSNDLMARLPKLGIIAVNGVGLDQLDLEAAAQRGIAVVNTPGVLADDVADLAVGLTIALLRDITGADRFVRDNAWASSGRALRHKVTGKRFGIYGLGAIGEAAAHRFQAFGPVFYTSRRKKAVDFTFIPTLEELARVSDVLVIANAATPENQGVIGATVLKALGPEGFLVNVSRGSLVDEAALISALEAGGVAGAALDVFADEPNVSSALRSSPKVLLSPHAGSATVETRAAMADLVLENLRAFLDGQRLVTPVQEHRP